MSKAHDPYAALAELEQAEAHYRLTFQVAPSADHLDVGRAWDRMRRAGDAARAALAQRAEPVAPMLQEQPSGDAWSDGYEEGYKAGLAEHAAPPAPQAQQVSGAADPVGSPAGEQTGPVSAAPTYTPQDAQPDKWRDTVDDMLTVCHMVASDDPRESINRLINWHVSVAMDPDVSSDAQALIDRGKREAQPEPVSAADELARPTTHHTEQSLADIAVAQEASLHKHAARSAVQSEPLSDEQIRDLVKECGLDWHRGFAPLFDGDETNRYAVFARAIERAVTERLRGQS